VAVGCAAGLDALCRQAFPCARVFSASVFGVGASALARRSAACVGAVVASGGLWVSFPCGVCPVGLVPSASAATCFSGSGSGSWASLCLAVGSGCSCCVVLPVGVAAPAWFGRWGFVAVGGGVWVRLVPVQSSLF
jgi:hypothetical protein